MGYVNSTINVRGQLLANKEKLNKVSVKGLKAEPRVSQISAKLLDIAKREGPDAKLPTVRELCVLLGTSINTLDDALSDLEKRQLIYRHHGRGVFVSPTINRKTVLVLLESSYFQNTGKAPFWAILWSHCVRLAQQRAAQHEETYEFRIVDPLATDQDMLVLDVLSKLQSGALSGALSIGLVTPLIEWSDFRNLSFVSYAGPGSWGVGVNTGNWVAECTKYLAQQGCRNVAFWTFYELQRHVSAKGGRVIEKEQEQLINGRQMLVEACAQAGLPFNPSNAYDGLSMYQRYLENVDLYDEFTDKLHQDLGYEYARQVFGRTIGRPDGILIMDDMVAFGAFAAFDELGVRPGVDVEICTFSNAGSAILYKKETAVSRMEIDPEEIVQTLFGNLELLMNGSRPENYQTLVPAKFYPRERPV